ncbi:hypothetical protein KJ940_14905 [Myxococcota bacterium]|nr:hypothetical protein [Myxococcota bacterium]
MTPWFDLLLSTPAVGLHFKDSFFVPHESWNLVEKIPTFRNNFPIKEYNLSGNSSELVFVWEDGLKLKMSLKHIVIEFSYKYHINFNLSNLENQKEFSLSRKKTTFSALLKECEELLVRIYRSFKPELELSLMGIIVNSMANDRELVPPGFINYIDHVGSMFINNTSIDSNINSIVEDYGDYFDGVIKKISYIPSENATFSLDFQRKWKEPTLMRATDFSENFKSFRKNALEYLSEFGEGKYAIEEGEDEDEK